MKAGLYSVLWAPVAAIMLEVVAPFLAAFGVTVAAGFWWLGRRSRTWKGVR